MDPARAALSSSRAGLPVDRELLLHARLRPLLSGAGAGVGARWRCGGASVEQTEMTMTLFLNRGWYAAPLVLAALVVPGELEAQGQQGFRERTVAKTPAGEWTGP